MIGSADTGIDESHSSLDFCFEDLPAGPTRHPGHSRIIAHQDFAGGPPYHPHGTWTAEILGRSARADGTYQGGLYKASFVYAQVLNASGQGTTSQVVDGLNYLASQGVWFVNMSLGGPHDPTMDAAVEVLWQKGIPCVCATGNSGRYPPACDGTIMSPADADHAIACGASDVAAQDPNQKGQRNVQTWTDLRPQV